MEEDSHLGNVFEDSLSEISESEYDSDAVVSVRPSVGELGVHSTLSSSEEDLELEENNKDWSEYDPKRNNEQFEGAAGVKTLPENPRSVSNVTSLFVGDDLFENIVIETNRYRSTHSHQRKDSTHGSKWVDATVLEIKKVFGLIIIMGLVRKNRILSYWSTNPLIATPLFSNTMGRDRFMQICSFLNFSNETVTESDENSLVKVQEIIDYFLNKFKSVYEPEQNLSLDVGVIPWRGKHRFRVYNPTKFIKCGILNRIICESKTGYICNFILDYGKDINLEDTIMNLMDPYLNKWHHLYVDSFYNSVNLTSTLLLHKVRICGTIRANRGVPNSLRNLKLKHGETQYKRKGEILIQLWGAGKNRNIQMISSIHNAKLINCNKTDHNTQLPYQRPHCIVDYSQNMNGVELVDQYLANNPIFKKSMKWTKKVFLYLLYWALFNSYCVFQKLNPKTKLKFHNFMLNVAQVWIEGAPDTLYSDADDMDEPVNYQPSTSPRTPRFDPLDRLTGNMKQHEPVKILKKNKNARRRCRVCYAHNIRRETAYMCKHCIIPLHLGECFYSYHTKKKY